MGNKNIMPFVKWAGGKRQLLDKIQERMPERYDRYYEPFVGGGAVLFWLQPENAVINDINRSLINAYQVIRDDPYGFMEMVKGFDEGLFETAGNEKAYYNTMRNRYNRKLADGSYDTETAALFVFINKHCFNGLHRVNRKGEFNVPYNGSLKGSINEKSILEVSEYLKNVKIMNSHFQHACKDAKAGDFIFFDSPYAPLNDTSFEAYTKEGFAESEHERLAALYDELTRRGCFCMLTNHDTDLINKLYGGKGYRIDVVDVRRSINSDASKRTGKEVIICNF